MSAVLEGVRVLDFGRYIAGPWCAAVLGDLGAEVIRVEKVNGSEDRHIMPVTPQGDGASHIQMNRNKLGLTLNPMKEEGREIVQRLVRGADVVVANLPPSGLEAMGLDYETLKAVKADIILTTVTAFGTGGPASDRVGFDGVAQALSGAMYLSGPKGHPTKSVVNFADFGTALFSAVGTLAALMHRKNTGEGQHVEASLLGTALSFMSAGLLEQVANQSDRVSSWNRSQHAGPADTLPTRDGWILVQCVGEPLFRRWCRLLGEEALLDDPRFHSDQARGDNGEWLSERMAAWCAERTTAQALSALDEARIPAGRVHSPQQALEDAHIRAMGFLKSLDYPGLDAGGFVGDTPVRFSSIDAGVHGRAPTLGEHTDAILGELGYSEVDIAALREKRVV
ncbi:CoA transferase [Ectothiorhodospiraceae bacterium WFHF3C12]|nr:CoA transferase [Ectothiorhodospiraceae bacterium WFHF3C12]